MNETLRFLSAAERELLMQHAEEHRYEHGDVILAEGAETDAVYVIRSGTARVEKSYFGAPVPVNHMDTGEMFGELSFLNETVASTSVVADGRMVIDVIPRRALDELLQADPVLASHIYHSLAVMLAERLRYRTDDLVVPSFNSG